MIRLCLLVYHREQIVEVVPIQALDRKSLESSNTVPLTSFFNKNAVSLKNGKVIRTVESGNLLSVPNNERIAPESYNFSISAAPSIENRTWKALNDRTVGANREDSLLNEQQIKGEVVQKLIN